MSVEIPVKDFNLEQTLECGQCFNFEKLANQDYLVMAKNHLLHVRQEASSGVLCFENASEEDVEDIWIPYFDLDRDYGAIKQAVAEADERLAPVLKNYYGIRILNQDFPETLISFIISQNKNIPQIKKIVRAICEGYGEKAGSLAGKDYYTFPETERLFKMTEDDFRNLKTGFRAPYIMNAISFLKENGPETGTGLSRMTFEDARKKLTSIKGVGDKVANCVLLFSLGFRAAFPVDVWIKRIMEEMYFGRETDKKVIEKFAAEKFGEFGGYAQQYLFMYAKSR